DIIVTGPLFRLEKVKGFSATLDSTSYLKIQFFDDIGHKLLIDNGYNLDEHNFCSGMFAFSTEVITPNTYEDLVTLSRQFLPIARLNDQAILNLYFYKQWQKLSMAYAFMLTCIPSLPFQRAKGAIALHFAF